MTRNEYPHIILYYKSILLLHICLNHIIVSVKLDYLIKTHIKIPSSNLKKKIIIMVIGAKKWH
ncbi:hypothetical protein Hanom_Chr04g00341201 [Helianthus anomalus]